MKNFDWIIVGGGIAGISLSEVLYADNNSSALSKAWISGLWSATRLLKSKELLKEIRC